MKKILVCLMLSVASTIALADSPLNSLLRSAIPAVLGDMSPKDLSTAPTAAPGVAGAKKGNCEQTRATPLPPIGSRPDTYRPDILWPDDSGCPAHAFSDYKFEQARAEKQAFVEASRVPCSSCEGGRSFDAWANKFLTKSGSTSAYTDMLIALRIGQSLAWEGQRFKGVIRATGDKPIGEFPCRQYHWALKDGSKIVAERDGLFCQYKAEYSSVSTWHEVL